MTEPMQADVVVLGGGIVGVSAAVHLQKRGRQVALLDRRAPGEETSFGNAGLIQRECVFPRAFPREVFDLARIARNGSIDAYYHLSALPALAGPLYRYWRESAPDRYAEIVLHYSRLIATCTDEHLALAGEAGAMDLLRHTGWMQLHSEAATLERELAHAEVAKRDFAVNYTVLDPATLAAAEPALREGFAGALHWTDPYAVIDPHGLTMAYLGLFERLGGKVFLGDAATLARDGAGWTVRTRAGALRAREAVVALGAWSGKVTAPLGYDPPLFGKRGYHMHYGMRGNAVLNHPVLDVANGYMLVPMRAGVRLTTGAEFATLDSPPTPVQLGRAEPKARALLPQLGERLDPKPWMGTRPCTPDMMPIVGAAPGQPGLWFDFGHAHQGLTLGPTTGRLLAEMMTGEEPFLDPVPYRADRF
ncbi:FAD-binding oxidoreductase [Roseomonas sp. NAR14]|uniref:FAD-binding oxidoreductase n=1 Tax=Roseomonas acroporae TaxID=2937791 RepID=A0A9X1YAI8_9PROT|nr:FAD-dependent oxidoreductase [Roseomonas acroporae]MCK8785858.1 FAD-binding oxidoreductase [Roseomonas acroporae]